MILENTPLTRFESTFMAKILVADDDRTSSRILEKVLLKGGHRVVLVKDGQTALKTLKHGGFEVLITDWMMPRMDGIELIRQAAALPDAPAVMLVVTVLTSLSARKHALEAGADECLGKPIQPQELLLLLDRFLRKSQHRLPRHADLRVTRKPVPHSMAGVGIAVSTGGPEAAFEVFRGLPATLDAAVFLVQHGPIWLLEVLAEKLAKESKLPVHLAHDGLRVAAKNVYVAPGGCHLRVEPSPLILRLVDEPPENFCRPSADPLFRSIADAFGCQSVAVVLTGLGHDGCAGAACVAGAGGIVLAQDPSTAVAPSMPRSVIEARLAAHVAPLDGMAARIVRSVRQVTTRDRQPTRQR